MTIELLQSDDLTPLDALAFTNVQAGADSDVLEVHLWNERGTPAGQPLDNVFLVQQTESKTTAGLFLASGLPPQDELWGLWRIIGYNNQGDPTWSVALTDWQPLGAYTMGSIGRIPADCAVHFERKLHPPSTASELAWVIADVVFADEFAKAVPAPLGMVDRGVVHFAGQGAHSGLLRGFEVTATGTPDEFVHVAAGFAQFAGLPYGFIGSSHELDQDDGSAATLGAGESYIATLSLGASGVTVTKGDKAAADPVAPAVPAGEKLLRYAEVTYQVGGTSVIEESDLSGDTLYDRFEARAGTGLELVVHPGDALGGGTHRFYRRSSSVTLSDDATNYVWQTAQGLWQKETTAAPPDSTSLLFWEVTTAAGVITAIVDRRTLVGKTVILRFSGAAPAVSGTLEELMSEWPELHWEETAFRVSDNGGGSSGQTQVDVLINGSTAFVSSGTEDLRPAVQFDATDLVDRTAIHETAVIRRGDLVEVQLSEEPVGGTPATLEVLLVCREA